MKDVIVTVKEREAGEPCFLMVEMHKAIEGLPQNKEIIFYMPDGTDHQQANRIADQLNDMDVTIKIR